MPTAPSALDSDIEYARRNERGYILRRALYIGIVTAFCLITSASVVVFKYDGDLPMKLVTGLLELASTLAMLYIGGGVLDRSQVLARIGDRFGGGTRLGERGEQGDRGERGARGETGDSK